jgi:hypothetical protein
MFPLFKPKGCHSAQGMQDAGYWWMDRVIFVAMGQFLFDTT